LRHKKTGEFVMRRLFLLPADPLMAMVAAIRKGIGGQTNFFGKGAAFYCEK
jgi:hypothetical protein